MTLQAYAMSRSKGHEEANNGKRIAVLGLGNILLSDEGAGIHAVEELRRRYHFPERVALIDGGTMGLDLLPFIEGMDNVLIIDAVNAKKEPGEIVIFEDREIPSFLSSKLSPHQIGLPDLLSAAHLTGMAPQKTTLIGIQPESMETGLDMSGKLQGRLDELLKVVLGKLREWGVNAEERDGTD